MEPVVTSALYNDTQRMQLRALILLSSEIIAQYWPMRTFIHHNPLHGLEELHFEEAAQRAQQLLGGKSYLPNELFRDYVRSGRILPHQIDAALKARAHDNQITLGNQKISQFDVLRAHLLQGISAPPEEVLDVMIARRADRTVLHTLADHITRVLTPSNMEAHSDEERAALGRHVTLAAWCDRTLGTQTTEQINREMIKWCEAFLDEEHAAWSMPGREKGFYAAWKYLAAREWSPCGIAQSRRKIARLPAHPEDALLEHLAALGIPSEAWQDYLALHFAAMPGWAGFIKWRVDQTDYEWQHVYPTDLVQYLAARLWYERELVQQACREELGIDGHVEAIRGVAASEDVPKVDRTGPHSRASSWRLLALANALEVAPSVLMDTAPDTLNPNRRINQAARR